MQILATHRILSAPVVAAGEGHDASETFKANSAGEEIICFVVRGPGRLLLASTAIILLFSLENPFIRLATIGETFPKLTLSH